MPPMPSKSLARRDILKTAGALALTTALGACAQKSGTVPAQSPAQGTSAPATAPAAETQQLLSEATEFLLRAYPESASNAGVDVGARAGLKSRLSDHSAEGQAAIAEETASFLARMERVNAAALPAPLPADAALALEVVRTVFERASEGFAFPFGDVALLNTYWSYRNSPYTVAQNTGAFVDIPFFLDSAHSVATGEDAQAYLARLEAFAGQLDGETERVRRDAAAGMILPDFLLAKTMGLFTDTLARNTADWGVVRSLAGKAAAIPGDPLPGDWKAEATAIAAGKIRPAIERQLAALEALAPEATSDAGVGARPRGDEYYAWALKASTTTDMTPGEVHAMGLEELDALHGRMDPILRAEGYTKGTVGERMKALAEDPRFQFSKGDKGREEIVALIEATLADIRTRMPEAFETLVPGFLEITRIPREAEGGAPAAYGGAGSIDGKQPGHFWINLRDTALHSRYSLPDLTYHEAIPGHVWQGEYTFKQPLIRSLLAFNAYSEGWALYAEQIADELGVYDDFPVGRLGYLQSLAFRACRLVVDTGLHAKGWSRERAVQFFVERNGSNPREVASEVDRYCAWPGQACGYKVGHTAINRLRTKAQDVLGERYDFRRFNDAVVLGGSVPMTVLARVIDNHIARELS